MEAIAVHSSPPTTSSPLHRSKVDKRQGRNDRTTKDGDNNNTRRKSKRARSSVSPTIKGNGRPRRRLNSETENDSDSQSTAQPAASVSETKFMALNTVQKRLNGAASSRYSDARDPQKTPKPKRSVQSTRSTRSTQSILCSSSPDPIDGLEEGSSPPPSAISDPDTPHSDEATPKPKSKRRERIPTTRPPFDASPTKVRGKSKGEIGRSHSDQPQATTQLPVEPSRPAAESFGESPRARRKSTVSTSIVVTKQKFDGEPRQRSQVQKSACSSTSNTPKERPPKAEAQSSGKKVKPTRPQKEQGKDRRRNSTKAAPADLFSDDESERVAAGSKKFTVKDKQSRRDKEGARYSEQQAEDNPDSPRSAETSKIKAKLQSERRSAAARFEEEDRETEVSLKGVELNNLQGESFFASTATVDIAETEERIARAQAAIDAKPVSLSQETDADESEEERYCARFCNYDDSCAICFGPMPKHPSNDSLKSRRKSKRGAHRTQGITFCTMHRAETKTLPLGWRAGYPKELDFENIDGRLEEGFIRDRIARVANSPTTSKFFRRAQRNVDLIGSTRWQSLTAQSSDEVSSTATPGYYGDLGRAIIIHHLQHLVKWKLLTLRADKIQPLSSTDFIIHVLVPEAAISLIMQDQGWEGGAAADREAARAKAMDTHRQSGEYGRAAFREESAQGREVLSHSEATSEEKRRRLERRAREEAEVHRSQVIEVSSSDPVDPSSDYGDDPTWSNNAFEAYEALNSKEATPRPRLPSTKSPRTALHSSQYR